MTLYLVATPVVLAILSLVCLGDRASLMRAYAKPRAHWLNVARWLATAACWAAVGIVWPQKIGAIGFACVVGLLLLVPYPSIIAVSGGRQPKGELRHVAWKASVIYDRKLAHRPPPTGQIKEMRNLIGQMERARTPETAEWCDLQLAECQDWLAGTSWLLAQGWRAIRAHELEWQIYRDFARPAKLSASEATFRWQLFRVFAWLTDTGEENMDSESRAFFERLLAELDEFRRPDTVQFIDLVKESTSAWLLTEPKTSPWMPSSGRIGLGPAINAEYDRLWPGTAVFHGAHLDERDREYFAQPAVLAAALGRNNPESQP